MPYQQYGFFERRGMQLNLPSWGKKSGTEQPFLSTYGIPIHKFQFWKYFKSFFKMIIINSYCFIPLSMRERERERNW